MGGLSFNNLLVDALRTLRSDFQRVGAGSAERAALGAASPPIVLPRTQDLCAWRASVLRVAFVVLATAFVVSFVGFCIEFFDAESVEGMDARIILVPGFVELLAHAYLLLQMVRALRAWTQPTLSTRVVRRGWFVAMLVPLLVLLVPWYRLVYLGTPPSEVVGNSQTQEGLRALIGGELVRLLLLVAVITKALPALLSIFPGIYRAGLSLKTLLPSGGLGPLVAAAAGPINALYIVVILVIVQSIVSSWALPFVGLLLLGAPLLTGTHCAQIVRPLDAAAASRAVARVRRISGTCVGLGLLGMILLLSEAKLFGNAQLLGWGGDNVLLGALDLIPLGLRLAGMLLVFSIVAADALVRGMAARRVGQGIATLGEDDGETVAAMGYVASPATPVVKA